MLGLMLVEFALAGALEDETAGDLAGTVVAACMEVDCGVSDVSTAF